MLFRLEVLVIPKAYNVVRSNQTRVCCLVTNMCVSVFPTIPRFSPTLNILLGNMSKI